MTARAFAPPRLFTVAEYYLMAEAGIFTEDDRVELIEGEIVAMSPIGSHHASCVNKVASLLNQHLPRGIVSVQNPVRLSEDSEPQPDITVLRPRDDFYDRGHPGPDDVLLLIEVADTSMLYDRNIKIPLYARSGIREVWLVDMVANVVEVHSGPLSRGYSHTFRFEPGATVVSTELPELQIPASEILIR